MSFTKCAYRHCDNTSRDFSLFRFPIHDKGRLILWIRNSGNIHLDGLTDHELSRRYLCSTHFPESSINRGIRNRLVGPAIPLHYQSADAYQHTIDSTNNPVEVQAEILSSPEVLKVKTPTKFYGKRTRTVSVESDQHRSPSPSEYGESSMVTPTGTRLSRRCLFDEPKRRLSRKCMFEAACEDTPKTRLLKTEATSLLKKNNAQRARLRRLEAKTKNVLNNSECFRSEVSKTLATMQYRRKDEKKKWTKKEKDFCMSLFYKSSSTYIFLRRQGVVLASPSTIRTWLAKSNCVPGLCDQIFQQIGKKFEHKSIKEKACVVSFDEMSIMSNLSYNKKYDIIEGYEDLGGGRRTNKMAKYALVFMARGLYVNWKFPVSYFLSHVNVKAENLQILLKTTINKLFDQGLLPKAVVCDQMSTNQKILKDLGVSCAEPFFYLNGRKIFALYDVPHLIKSIRNNFLGSNFIYNGQEISFQDIIKTYEIDRKSSKSRSLTKITERHLKPNSFQKMNVSLATQIFSNSVCAAMKTAIKTGELKSETAVATADFVKIINDMFDGLNSGSKYDKNPKKYALSKYATSAMRAIEDGKATFESLKKITFKKIKGQFKKDMTRPPCFDGVIQSCEAVIQIFQEETTEKSVTFIMTKKLNQDVIEIFFARLRQKGGSNRNPTARLLRTIFRSNLVNSLIKLPLSSNCQDEGDDFLNLVEPRASEMQAFDERVTLSEDCTLAVNSSIVSVRPEGVNDVSISMASSAQTTTHTVPVTLEQCSLCYFAGYLAKTCLSKFNCNECNKNLTKDVDLDDVNQLLILNKSYNCHTAMKLKMPSDNLVTLLNFAIECYNMHFGAICHCVNIRSRLFTAIMKYLECEAKELLNSISCLDHIKYIINHMIYVKINFYCKTQKNCSVSSAKLRILNNK